MKYYIRDKQKTYGPADMNKISQRLVSQKFSVSALLSEDGKTWSPVTSNTAVMPAALLNKQPPMAAAPMQPAAGIQASPNPMMMHPAASMSENHSNNNNNNNTIIIISIIAAVLVVLLVGGILLFMSM